MSSPILLNSETSTWNANPAYGYQHRQAVFQAEFHSDTSDANEKFRLTLERELVKAV